MTKRLVIVLGLAGWLAAGTATAGGPYTITELKPLKGSVAFAFDVNLAGQATGVMTEETAGSTFFRGFFYDPRTGLVDIGSLGGANTFAERLNDHGVVTGSSETGTGTKVHAFVYTPGVGMRDIGAGSGDQSFGNDIDEAGNVIGSLFPGDHAFFWDGSTLHDRGAASMVAFDSAGDAYGYVPLESGVVPGVWSPPLAPFIPFGSVPDPFRNGYAFDGNIFGNATGELTGGGDQTAFYWDGHYRQLRPSGFAFSSGESINDADNVVIKAFGGAPDDVPFLYRLPNSDPVNGNALNPSGSPFSSLLEFTSIDDIGHISGAGRVGNEVHGFVLTPAFGTELDTVSLILEGYVPPKNPFFKYVETMRRLGLVAEVNRTSCYEFRQLRQSLSVSQGVPFSQPQRTAARDALAAILAENKCPNTLPASPVTVPHIFSRKNEQQSVAVRTGPGSLRLTTRFPPGSGVDFLAGRVFQTAGKRSSASIGSTVKRVKLKITKARRKTSVQVKVAGLKKGTLHFTLVARKLLNGKPAPVTTKVAK